MKGRITEILKNEQGTQIVEFILIFPLIWFLFIFGVDQFTIIFNKQKVLAAAYEAGRFACIQPTYKLARYYAEKHAMEELGQALSVEESDVELIVERRWEKGDHVEARVTASFPLLATGGMYTIQESYTMMIESPVD